MRPKSRLFVVMMLLATMGLHTGCEREAFVVRNPALLIAGTDLLDFGEIPVNYTATRRLQLANAGQQTLKIEEMLAESLGDVFAVTSMEDSILGGDSIEIEVSFTPTAELLYEGTLAITSNSSLDESVRVSLKGVGLVEMVVIVTIHPKMFAPMKTRFWCTRAMVSVLKVCVVISLIKFVSSWLLGWALFATA